MVIRISEILKELRLKHGNTQGELADFLGVTVQSVSKWERGEGMPDISFLPQIAGYYSVSVDTLLGVDKEQKEEKIKKICTEYNRIRQCPPREDGTLIVENNIEEGIEFIRSALRDFPDCWFFMQLLASDLWELSKSKNGKGRDDLLNEAESLCRKILDYCTENRWRNCATEILCVVLFERGDKKQAIEMAYGLPDAVGSNDYMLTNVLEDSELERQLNISIREFIGLAYLSFQKLNDKGFSKERLREQKHIKVQLDAMVNSIYRD